MEQNEGRKFLPVLCATIKASMNAVVFRKFAPSRRCKFEMDVRDEFHVGGFAFGRNETRSTEKLNGFSQICIAPSTFAD